MGLVVRLESQQCSRCPQPPSLPPVHPPLCIWARKGHQFLVLVPPDGPAVGLRRSRGITRVTMTAMGKLVTCCSPSKSQGYPRPHIPSHTPPARLIHLPASCPPQAPPSPADETRESWPLPTASPPQAAQGQRAASCTGAGGQGLRDGMHSRSGAWRCRQNMLLHAGSKAFPFLTVTFQECTLPHSQGMTKENTGYRVPTS
jgi:hypothetical protein